MTDNAALIRSVRGPIILITIGVLFAIDHSGGIPFERTWPAVIIMIGLMKLLERAVATPFAAPPAYPSGPSWTPQYPAGYQPPPQPPPPANPEDPNAGGVRQ